MFGVYESEEKKDTRGGFIYRLQNSPYFCVFNYARAKRSGTRLKTESETGERH